VSDALLIVALGFSLFAVFAAGCAQDRVERRNQKLRDEAIRIARRELGSSAKRA